MVRPRKRAEKRPDLVNVHARLFPEDVKRLKEIAAAKGLPWQVELRLTVRRALKGATEKLVVIEEGGQP